MTDQKKMEINFLDSFLADTSIVPEIIDQIINDLRTLNYCQNEIDEIILSMDEAVTNAVQETLSVHHTPKTLEMKRQITVRYKITPTNFDATIIDHGKGLDIKRMLSLTPDIQSDFYHKEILAYVDKAEKSKLKVRINGKEVILNGIGAGLKIILTFMDSVTIDLIDKKKIVSDSVTQHTDGTILNLYRKKRSS